MPSLMYFPVSLFEFLGKQKHNLIMPSSRCMSASFDYSSLRSFGLFPRCAARHLPGWLGSQHIREDVEEEESSTYYDSHSSPELKFLYDPFP